jgi:putrescine transport system substrate-binding protein
MRRLATFAAAFATFALLLAAPAQAAPERRVNVYNWNDYIAMDVLEQFRRETGIKVVYDVYDSNEMLEAKLLAGGSGYDVVFPTARPFAQRHMQRNVYLKLDPRALPNRRNLDQTILASLRDIDPRNEHLLPYTWGTTGIGYNRRAITQRLGANAQPNTWRLLFDPAIAAKLASCGIAVLDDAEEALHAALIYLGKNPSSTQPADLTAAIELFARVRPHIRYFHSSRYIDDLANGNICVAMGYSGDVLQARDRAREARRNVEVAYTVPREGAIMWVDLMAIPRDAPNKANALAFVNFLMRPDVMAKITNEVAYANGNAAATRLVDPAIRNDPGVYPDRATMARMKTAKNLTAAERRVRTRAFTRIRTGR